MLRWRSRDVEWPGVLATQTAEIESGLPSVRDVTIACGPVPIRGGDVHCDGLES